MKKNSEEKSQLIKFESIDVLEEQKPKQIEKDDFVPFRIRRSQIESRLTQKDTVRQVNDLFLLISSHCLYRKVIGNGLRRGATGSLERRR